MSSTTERLSLAEKAAFRNDVLRHVAYSLGTTIERVSPREVFRALALAIRDRMVEGMLATERRCESADVKRLYYLSMEFLIGRSLTGSLINLGLLDVCRDVLAEFGIDIGQVEESEVDAALGNGGLGRLAACFLESLASLDMPGFGYGINYEYGLFKQEIKNGEQVEKPDNWRFYNTPWQIERPDEAVIVPLYGRIEHGTDRSGQYNPMWLDWKVVIGVPFDMPVVGYGGKTVNYLRLYTARASHEVDMSIFNEGDYLRAVQQQVSSETISKVLYPTESVQEGRELRLVQEYFLVACTVRDIFRRYLKRSENLAALPEKVVIQMNDTHPALAVAELMRILVDENGFPWKEAWEITSSTLAYTNHTLLPEALEKWPVPLMSHVLPRHMQIIFEINHVFLSKVAGRWHGDEARLRRMSLIEEGGEQQVRMANLAIVGSCSVNGVAAVHSELVKKLLVPDFYELWPEKFNNKTNGVTQRRWLLVANPGLSELISETIGSGWIRDLDRLRELESLSGDAEFQQRFAAVKRGCKQRLARVVKKTTGVSVDVDTLFDVQVKRIHEYKRQLLNVLHIVHEYLRLADDGATPVQPRTYVFSDKAAPGYHTAKRIIRLVSDVARVVNGDRRAAPFMKVAFVPDYKVSLAEAIIPAADLSEQISTAGMEASGTGNMKFALNGALTIGTLDGANIEIREEVGPENIFIFGLTVEEVHRLASEGAYHPRQLYERDPTLARTLDAFRTGRFSPGDPGCHGWVFHSLLADGERYFHLADFASYLEAHEQAGQLYRRPAEWATRAILNVARTGKFSSDRTIRDYARDIWKIESVQGPV